MIDVRPIRDDEADQFRDALMTTFGDDREVDPDGAARLRALVAPGRAWAAFDGGAVVATAASFAHAIGIPGGTLAMAGLTMVSVRPSHRRRGLMSALIRRHLDDARAHGEVVSGLWASEATIYGRFGFGIAAEGDALEVDVRGLDVAGGLELDTTEWLDEAAARERLPAIYARATADRPGALRRSAAWWRERRFLEAAFTRGGASRRRHVAARRGDELVGYVVYRQTSGWDRGVADGRTDILELIAVDGRAEATLWRFVAGIDLFPTATWSNAPVDSALPWLAADPRRVRRRRTDTLWLRLDDVAAALAARRYAHDGALRFSVDGQGWQLHVDGGHATCTPTTAPPELALDRAGLSSLYLGGIAATTLGRAGRIQGTPAALTRADQLFGWPVAPWCAEVF